MTEAAKPGPWPGCAPSPTSHAPFRVLLALAIISLALASNTGRTTRISREARAITGSPVAPGQIILAASLSGDANDTRPAGSDDAAAQAELLGADVRLTRRENRWTKAKAADCGGGKPVGV